MAAALLFMALVLSITIACSSGASYCVCIEGEEDTALQQDIDYACGAGADCSAILADGDCYEPNTVKSHCDYAVNSYFQNMAQVPGSCNFSGTATVTNTPPSSIVSGCQFPATATATASSSQASAMTPSSIFPSINSSTATTGSTTFGVSPNAADSTLIPDGNGSPKHHADLVSTTIVIVISQCVWFYGLERRPFLH